MRGLAVVVLALLGMDCGGQTKGAGPPSSDAGSAMDGDTACPAGELLCDVCGTVGCYAGACPMRTCSEQVTCPLGLPQAGSGCIATAPPNCPYTTSTSPCGAVSCDCARGTWRCSPSCTVLPIPDAGGDAFDLVDAGDDDAGPCPPGETFCVEGCAIGYPTCVVGNCPVPPPCAVDPNDTCLADGKRLCQPCLNVPPVCDDIGACLPATSCPGNPDGAAPECAGGEQACPVDCRGDYVCLNVSSWEECPPVCTPPAMACYNGTCVPMR